MKEHLIKKMMLAYDDYCVESIKKHINPDAKNEWLDLSGGSAFFGTVLYLSIFVVPLVFSLLFLLPPSVVDPRDLTLLLGLSVFAWYFGQSIIDYFKSKNKNIKILLSGWKIYAAVAMFVGLSSLLNPNLIETTSSPGNVQFVLLTISFSYLTVFFVVWSLWLYEKLFQSSFFSRKTHSMYRVNAPYSILWLHTTLYGVLLS
jgi:hypothetical protein